MSKAENVVPFNDRQKALDAALSQIDKAFGKGSAGCGRRTRNGVSMG